MTKEKICPVCGGRAISEYRLYHDCQLNPRVKPIDVSPPRRPDAGICPVCKQPDGTLMYCAGCRTAWIVTKPVLAVSPTVPASDSITA